MDELVNRERLRTGLPPVILDQALCELAELKARDMKDCGYFGHYSEALGSMPELVERVLGHVPRVGENIALYFPSDEAVHQAWMGSTLHRKNILDSFHERVGYAWAELDGTGRIYVQVFTGSREQ